MSETMNAVTIDRFGGIERLNYGRRPRPEPGPGQILVRVAHAAVASWDPFVREGGFVQFTGHTPDFPYTLGGEGSGTVAAIGTGVERFEVGDEVYAIAEGFYAEYVVVDASAASHLPAGLSLDQAGAMPTTVTTAWQGLVESLELERGERLVVVGASGDVGLVAVPMARLMGARILAVASGADGVEAVRALGAERAVDRHGNDLSAELAAFAPDGVDAVLAFSSGPSTDAAIAAMRSGGRLAFPLGIEPEPAARDGVEVRRFDQTVDDPATFGRKMAALNRIIASGPFDVRIAKTFPLAEAAAAQEALEEHRVGRIMLRVG